MLVLIVRRALPRCVPKIRDLKKLFGGRSKNFWYGVEEDWYLEASALGVRCDEQKNSKGGRCAIVGNNVSSLVGA